jgi:membrane fusion protein (multidrug efflux system)
MRSTMMAILVFALMAGTAIAQPAPPAATPVGTVVVERKPVTTGTSFVGRAQAINRVDIVARVTGYLDAVQFTEGDAVAEGAKLFLIEPGPFQAAVQQSEGEVLRAQAQLTNATLQRQRADELVKTAAMPVAQRDERVAAEQSAKGQVDIAEAGLATARINLGYTSITAPIAGRIGRASVTKGNVVGPNSGVLTTIVSVDPIYVVFPVSARVFLDLQKKGGASQRDSLIVRARFSDGSIYDQSGKINFVDVTVNQATDTIVVRANFPNPKGVLVDGQLLQVVVEGDRPVEKVLVPQAALIADQAGTYVFIVENGKATIRRLKVSGEYGAEMIVEDGLTGGEQVIVQGLQTLRPGAAVLASPLPPPVSSPAPPARGG